jgi:hypothetical protein
VQGPHLERFITGSVCTYLVSLLYCEIAQNAINEAKEPPARLKAQRSTQPLALLLRLQLAQQIVKFQNLLCKLQLSNQCQGVGLMEVPLTVSGSSWLDCLPPVLAHGMIVLQKSVHALWSHTRPR